jgi:hypothetical protein
MYEAGGTIARKGALRNIRVYIILVGKLRNKPTWELCVEGIKKAHYHLHKRITEHYSCLHNILMWTERPRNRDLIPGRCKRYFSSPQRPDQLLFQSSFLQNAQRMFVP